VGHELQAVISRSALLRAAASGLSTALVRDLRQKLALLPITDELFDDVTDGSGAALGFWKLPGGFDRVLANWSKNGPFAYVEAEFFGGVGMQRAAVWSGGAVAWGPLGMGKGDPPPAEGSPVSQALRQLGVRRGAAIDEFAAVGLSRHQP
jgi:hypothetical protein